MTYKILNDDNNIHRTKRIVFNLVVINHNKAKVCFRWNGDEDVENATGAKWKPCEATQSVGHLVMEINYK